MAYDMAIHKVAQDVLLYMCSKTEAIKDEPKNELPPEVTTHLMDNLRITVWMEVFRNEIIWKYFFKNHFKRMTSSPYRFILYATYACYILIKESDAFDSFLDTLSIVAHFAYQCWDKESKYFIDVTNMCVALFCEFFEEEIRVKFEEQGGWQVLNEYLMEHPSFTTYKSLIEENESIFEHFKFVENEIRMDEGNFEVKNVYFSSVTHRQVETHRKTAKFAKSFGNKMKELFKQSFDEISMHFANEYNKYADSYYQKIFSISGDASSNDEKLSTSQEIRQEASENTPKTKSEKQELEKETPTALDLLDSQHLSTVNFQGGIPPGLHLDTKSIKSEEVKKLLSDLSMDIARLSGFVQSLCEEHGIHVPIQVATDSEVVNI